MKRASLAIAVLIMGYAMSVSADCSWVLWVEHVLVGVGDKKYQRGWTPESAYPADGYPQCIQDAQALAERAVEVFQNPQKSPGVKHVEMTTLIGKRQSVMTEFKNGGVSSTTYACLPHPVKPK